jgi:hypothetical protein
MRFKEILAEAKINLSDFQRRNTHYWRNLLQLIQSGTPIKIGASGSQLVTVAEPEATYDKLSSIWDGSTVATSEILDQLKKLKLTTDDGSEFRISEVFKSPEIKGGAEGKIKFWNLGNVVEGIMGAAVTAKFSSPNKEITEKDVSQILLNLKAGTPILPKGKSKADPITPFSYSTKVSEDSLTFTLSLNSTDLNALMMSVNDQDKLKEYPNNEEIFKAFTNAAIYVNTANTVNTAISRVQADSNKNQIIVESEGGNPEKQTSTKADLFITIDGVRERLLSLKSKTIPQIGQVSGHAFDNLDAFFKSVVGINIPEHFAAKFPAGTFQMVGRQIFEEGYPPVYKYVFSKLNGELANDDTRVEYNFIKQVYDGIIHHATLGEDVVIVYLSPSAKKAYTELRFGSDLLEALHNFDLKPVLANTATLKIVGVPKTELAMQIAGNRELELIQMRSYISAGKNIRNIVEVGPLLKILANVQNSSPDVQMPLSTAPANKNAPEKPPTNPAVVPTDATITDKQETPTP